MLVLSIHTKNQHTDVMKIKIFYCGRSKYLPYLNITYLSW